MSYSTIHSPPYRDTGGWRFFLAQFGPSRADINLDSVAGRSTVVGSLATLAAVLVALAHFPSKLPFYLIFTLHRD